MSEISLKEYFEARLEEADLRNEQRFRAQEEALKLALAAKNINAALAVSLVVGLMALAVALFTLFK
jgi:hypothetical protein